MLTQRLQAMATWVGCRDSRCKLTELMSRLSHTELLFGPSGQLGRLHAQAGAASAAWGPAGLNHSYLLNYFI